MTARVFRTQATILAAVALGSACAARRPAVFAVVPATPNYHLRSPSADETPFPDVLADFTGVGDGWVDLRPDIELGIENTYYRDGTSERSFENYLGTASIRYRVGSDGTLSPSDTESNITHQPADQRPIDQLLSAAVQHRPYHRFFHQVLIKKGDEHRRAVLLSATDQEAIDRLTAQLAANPGAVCDHESTACTVFPPTSTASLQIRIVVNGDERWVTWGSEVRNIAVRSTSLEVRRFHDGRAKPVEIDPDDPEALRLPLLPGDKINWR